MRRIETYFLLVVEIEIREKIDCKMSALGLRNLEICRCRDFDHYAYGIYINHTARQQKKIDSLWEFTNVTPKAQCHDFETFKDHVVVAGDECELCHKLSNLLDKCYWDSEAAALQVLSDDYIL